MIVNIAGFVALAALIVGLFGWLRTDVADVKADVKDLRAGMAELRERMARLEGTMAGERRQPAA